MRFLCAILVGATLTAVGSRAHAELVDGIDAIVHDSVITFKDVDDGSDRIVRQLRDEYGMQPAIIGTLFITLLASLIAIPIGILGAVYLNEYGKNRRLATAIRFLTDVMTGVPSVVMGIFVYTVFVLQFKERTTLAGALALACLMLPIVVRSTEEMLKLVPDNLREASAALGTRTWRTTVGVVLPAALPGITSGCMLAIARAAGETAPLLFTIGSISHFAGVGHMASQLGEQNTSLATQIFSNATQPGGEPLAWGAALTLIVMVLVLTMLARVVTARFGRVG